MPYIHNSDITRNRRFYYNRLFHDYIFDFPALKDFFPYDYRTLEGFKKRINDIRNEYDSSQRGHASAILKDINSRLGAGKETMENINRLAEKDSLVIIGGQQPGLFSGPSFVMYKVMTVINLSRYIREKTGLPVIPCFWNASDDSGPGQADRIGLLDGGYRELKIDTAGISEQARLSQVLLPSSSYSHIIEESGFADETGSFLKRVIKDAGRREGREGYVGLSGLSAMVILRLFSPWGPVIIDPLDRGLKEMGSCFLDWDMKEHGVINRLLIDRGIKLKEAGYHSQLQPNKDVLDFFISKEGIREKIKILPGGRFQAGGISFDRDGLLAAAGSDPLSVSWNVVLRPLIQDTFLPVAASVCGPGEVSYFAQLESVYRYRDMHMPVIFPRYSATLIERETRDLMARTGVQTLHIGMEKEEAVKAVLRARGASDIEGLAGKLNRDIGAALEKMENRVKKDIIDPGSAFERIKRNLGNEVKVLSKKLFAALKKKNKNILDGIDRIYDHLFPLSELQERKVCIFYFLDKYGIGLLEELLEAFRPAEQGHRFFYIEEEKKDEKK